MKYRRGFFNDIFSVHHPRVNQGATVPCSAGQKEVGWAATHSLNLRTAHGKGEVRCNNTFALLTSRFQYIQMKTNQLFIKRFEVSLLPHSGGQSTQFERMRWPPYTFSLG